MAGNTLRLHRVLRAPPRAAATVPPLAGPGFRPGALCPPPGRWRQSTGNEGGPAGRPAKGLAPVVGAGPSGVPPDDRACGRLPPMRRTGGGVSG